MPTRISWTKARDGQLRRLRAEGATWDAIAATLGLTRSTVIDRGRRIGARRPPPGPPSMVEDPGRAPLPPGHPRTWGAIVAGSVLEGDPYPYPVFDI